MNFIFLKERAQNTHLCRKASKRKSKGVVLSVPTFKVKITKSGVKEEEHWSSVYRRVFVNDKKKRKEKKTNNRRETFSIKSKIDHT